MAKKKTTSAPPAHPVEGYIRGVLDGTVLVGRLVKLAVERHVQDLDAGADRGLVFDQAAAQKAIDFFRFLKHSKGEWAGQSFELSPWQQFILWALFGWKRADGHRRFRTAYVEIPRKNGKSTLAAGIGLYLFFADKEPGAEVYTAATKRDQARIVHSEAIRMVKASTGLSSRIRVLRDNLSIEQTASKYEPLGADADTADGLNIHGAIVDELHAHKTRALLDVLDTATGARRQPLIFVITTAGHDRNSVCWEQRRAAEQVLEGVSTDDTLFGFVATVDKGDSWKDPRTWQKANPNFGVSVKVADLQAKARKAELQPGYQNAFRRLHLNEWTEQAERWLDMDRWDECADPFDAAELEGRRCYAGLDLATKVDLCALALLFPPDDDDDLFRVLMWFWCPEEGIRRRSEKDSVPYQQWVDEGLLTPTEGEVTDYEVIREEIRGIAGRFELLELGFDPWNALHLATQLQSDGVQMVEVAQNFRNLSEPSKKLEELVMSRRLAHGGNPVLRWMAGNVAIIRDNHDNIKPSKPKSTEKIDGIAAIVNALSRYVRHDGGDVGESVYDQAGIEVWG